MSGTAKSGNAGRPAGMFSSGQAAKIAGVAHRSADFWARQGVVIPQVPATGTGTDRWYSAEDLVALTLCGELDLSVACRKRVIEAFRSNPDPPDGLLIVQLSEMLWVYAAIDRIRAGVGLAVARAAGRQLDAPMCDEMPEVKRG